MELVSWRPFGELGSSRGEMDRLWNKFFSERPLVRTVTEECLPLMNISETEDEFLIKADPNIGGKFEGPDLEV